MSDDEYDALFEKIDQEDLARTKVRVAEAFRKAEILLTYLMDGVHTTHGLDQIIAKHPIDSMTLKIILNKVAGLNRSDKARLAAASKNADMREYVSDYYKKNKSRYNSKEEFTDNIVDDVLPAQFVGRKIPTKTTVREWLPKDGRIK